MHPYIPIVVQFSDLIAVGQQDDYFDSLNVDETVFKPFIVSTTASKMNLARAFRAEMFNECWTKY